jgi:CRISPR-associated protein Cmr3
MRYLVTLTPLEPFLFGGDTTFGQYANKEEGSYLVHSTHYPQQSALLGMLRKEFMIQAGCLTRKRRGEWVDKGLKQSAKDLVGSERFDIKKRAKQNFGTIEQISPIFLLQEGKRYIKKVAIDNYIYSRGLLKKRFPKDEDNPYYTDKDKMYDNYICLDEERCLEADNIWKSVEQIGNKKGGEENSLFKKTSFLLKDGFKFAFYLDTKDELNKSIVMLGADRSSFKMEVLETTDALRYESQDYITLLSDAYIPEPLACEFAITSELSYRQIIGLRSSMTKNEKAFKNNLSNPFQKSKRIFLYEKGSVIFKPSVELLDSLNNKNLQQIGYNIFAGEAQ